MEIKVSVVCMTFNQNRYIRKALDGLVMQKTNFPYEIIVHDDASTDGTAEIVSEYAEKYSDRIVPILQKKNQFSKGTEIYRTCILPKIRGEYIALCEGDDFWIDPEKLQLQYDAMVSHPECSMVTHKVQGVSENEKDMIMTFPAAETKEGIVTDHEAIRRAFHNMEWVFHTTSYFIRRELIEEAYKAEIGFFVRPMYGDQATFQLAAAKGHFYYIDRTMSCYRMGAVGSMVKTDKDSRLRQMRAQKAISALDDFDKYTEGRFREDVEYIRKRYQFVCLETNKEFKKMLSPEYKEYYNLMPLGAKMHIQICAIAPFMDSLYYKIRKIVKKY